jgi:hypothetical protein
LYFEFALTLAAALKQLKPLHFRADIPDRVIVDVTVVRANRSWRLHSSDETTWDHEIVRANLRTVVDAAIRQVTEWQHWRHLLTSIAAKSTI